MASFSKNSLMTFLTEIALFVFGLISLVIITRILGPEGKGIYSLILLVPALIVSFGNFGIGSANIYFAGNKKYKIQDIVSNSLILAFLLGIILILLFWILLHFEFFADFVNYSHLPSLYLWIVVLSIPVSLLYSFFQNTIRGTGEIINYNKTRLVESALGFLTVVVFLLILRRGIFGAILSYLISILGVTAFTFILVRKFSKIRFFINKTLLKESFIYGGKVYLASAVSFLNYRLDIFLIALILRPAAAAAAVGFYSIAVAMAEKMFIIPNAFSTVLFPKIASIEKIEADELTPRVVRHTFFIMIILSAFLLFLIKPIILIVFGSVFLPAVMPMLVLLPGIVAFGVGGVIAADLSGRGKPQYAIYSSAACLIVNIILNIVFIPKWGISGAALASSISYWVDTLIIIFAFLKISGKTASEILLIKSRDLKDYIRLTAEFKNWLTLKKQKI